MEDTDMKKTYIKPEQRVVLLQHKTMLLAGSVINPGVPNAPAGSRIWDDDDGDDDWDEDDW